MWIHLPSTCCPSAPESEASTSGSDELFQRLERSATWSGKSTAAASWRRVWRRGGFIRRLSGLTSRPSTAARGVDSWMRSLAATRASLSAARESASEQMILDTCGHTLPESLGRCSLPWCSLKTSPTTSTSASRKSASPYRRWAIELRRQYGLRRRQARLTAGSDSSHWPTTTTTDAKASGAAGYSTESGRHSGTTLTDAAVRGWPTPQHADGERQSETMMRGNPTLLGAALGLAWPTPRATDGAKGGPSQRGSSGDLMLPSAAVLCVASAWPTPAARDYRSPNAEAYQERSGTTKGEQLPNFVAHLWQTPATFQGAYRRQAHQTERSEELLPAQPARVADEVSPASRPDQTARSGGGCRPQLNPLFVEWLMGLPFGWTALEPSETASFLNRLKQLCASCCARNSEVA